MSTLKETAEQALVGLIGSVTDAASFLKGQIPIAVQELLTYYTTYFAVGMVGGAVILVATFLVSRGLLREYWKREARDKAEGRYPFNEGWLIGSSFLGVLGGTGGATLLVVAGLSFLKITLAPRIWLIEYAAHLVK